MCRSEQRFHDGSIHVVPEPLDLSARLAAMVSRSRLDLIRIVGVSAANFNSRHRMVLRQSQPYAEQRNHPIQQAMLARSKR